MAMLASKVLSTGVAYVNGESFQMFVVEVTYVDFATAVDSRTFSVELHSIRKPHRSFFTSPLQPFLLRAGLMIGDMWPASSDNVSQGPGLG